MKEILLIYVIAVIYTNSIAFICSSLCKPIMNRDIAKIIKEKDLIVSKGSLYESNSALKFMLYLLMPGKNLQVLVSEIKSHADLDRLVDDMLVDGRLKRQGDDFYEEKEAPVIDSVYKKIEFEAPAKYKAAGNNQKDLFNESIDPITFATIGEDDSNELSPFSKDNIIDFKPKTSNTLELRAASDLKSESTEIKIDEKSLLAKYIVGLDSNKIYELETQLQKVRALKEKSNVA